MVIFHSFAKLPFRFILPRFESRSRVSFGMNLISPVDCWFNLDFVWSEVRFIRFPDQLKENRYKIEMNEWEFPSKQIRRGGRSKVNSQLADFRANKHLNQATLDKPASTPGFVYNFPRAQLQKAKAVVDNKYFSFFHALVRWWLMRNYFSPSSALEQAMSGGDGSRRSKIKLIFITQINFLPFIYEKFQNLHFGYIFRIPSELNRL